MSYTQRKDTEQSNSVHKAVCFCVSQCLPENAKEKNMHGCMEWWIFVSKKSTQTYESGYVNGVHIQK